MTEERELHIRLTHPDLLPEFSRHLELTLFEPDEVRRSPRMSTARMFYRWFEDVHRGKYIAVVVVTESAPDERSWIITAYLTRRLMNGVTEWKKS